MKALSSSDQTKVKRVLPKKFKKNPVKYAKKDGAYWALYNDRKEYITSIQDNALNLKEYVTPIDNRKDNYTRRGRPAYRNYEIKKGQGGRLLINPVGVPWHMWLPYTGPADFQRFLLAADAKCDAMDASSSLVRGASVVVKIPVNREPHLKNIFKNGKGANPYYKEDVSRADTPKYQKSLMESRGHI